VTFGAKGGKRQVGELATIAMHSGKPAFQDHFRSNPDSSDCLQTVFRLSGASEVPFVDLKLCSDALQIYFR
jgi:hypothetical protein